MASHDSDFHDLSVATPTMNRFFKDLIIYYQQFLSIQYQSFTRISIENFLIFIYDSPNFGQI